MKRRVVSLNAENDNEKCNILCERAAFAAFGYVCCKQYTIRHFSPHIFSSKSGTPSPLQHPPFSPPPPPLPSPSSTSHHIITLQLERSPSVALAIIYLTSHHHVAARTKPLEHKLLRLPPPPPPPPLSAHEVLQCSREFGANARR